MATRQCLLSLKGHSLTAQGLIWLTSMLRHSHRWALLFALEGEEHRLKSKAFHDFCYGFMAHSNDLGDRVAGIQQLADQYPYMDLERVGIIGLDGMSSPVYGLLEYPSFYKVGVAILFIRIHALTALW